MRSGATRKRGPPKGGTPNLKNQFVWIREIRVSQSQRLRVNAFGVPHSCGLTYSARPNPSRSRAADTLARHASPHQCQFAPDTPLRWSTANPSSASRSRAARDCDARNSASPSNADPTAFRARRRERKLFARAPAPGRSRHARRRASMQQSQLTQQSFYVRRFHQRVIMIRQHAPCKHLASVRGK